MRFINDSEQSGFFRGEKRIRNGQITQPDFSSIAMSPEKSTNYEGIEFAETIVEDMS